MMIKAIGGFEVETGLPYVGWWVSFDDGATYCRPRFSIQLDATKPQVELWRGTGEQYDALRDGGYPALEWWETAAKVLQARCTNEVH